MSNLTGIRRRIKSARNISQITKAMEMVAASKMQKAQNAVLSSRPYAEKLDTVVRDLSGRVKLLDLPLLKQPKAIKNVAVLVVSTNRGLCGSLNTNLFREIQSWQAGLPGSFNISYITVGRKAHGFVARSGHPLLAEFQDLPEHPSFQEIRPISKLLLDGFLSNQFDQVVAVYARFVNTISQEPTIKELLPAKPAVKTYHDLFERDYVFEPSPTSVLNAVLPYRFELMLYEIILEARASEHSARMVAMKNAHDNASDLVHGLTIDYNRVRQSTVTNELLDVTTARAALGE